jgi:hypothetical protein
MIARQRPNEVFPDEPPGSYPHVLGAACWCKPAMLGGVIVHRPWAECAREVADDLLRSDVFPMAWETQKR